MLWRFLRNSEIRHKIEPVERQGRAPVPHPAGGHRQRAGRAAHGPPPFGHGMSGHLTTGGRMRRWREESNEVKWQWLRRLRTEGGERRDPQRKERMLERIDLGIYRTRKGIYGRRGVRQRQCPVVGACRLLIHRTPRCGGVVKTAAGRQKMRAWRGQQVLHPRKLALVRHLTEAPVACNGKPPPGGLAAGIMLQLSVLPSLLPGVFPAALSLS